MTYAIYNRAADVREGWPAPCPPPASLIHAVLRLRGKNRNTADIADKLGVTQAAVVRICEVDQDIRHYARSRLAATA